jgi:hypothetical protein
MLPARTVDSLQAGTYSLIRVYSDMADGCGLSWRWSNRMVRQPPLHDTGSLVVTAGANLFSSLVPVWG